MIRLYKAITIGQLQEITEALRPIHEDNWLTGFQDLEHLAQNQSSSESLHDLKLWLCLSRQNQNVGYSFSEDDWLHRLGYHELDDIQTIPGIISQHRVLIP